jgi:hypothetical protein
MIKSIEQAISENSITVKTIKDDLASLEKKFEESKLSIAQHGLISNPQTQIFKFKDAIAQAAIHAGNVSFN